MGLYSVIGAKTVSSADIIDYTLVPDPEALVIAADAPGSGQHPEWLWSWGPGVVYSRLKITNQVQGSVPLYKSSVYTVYNFAAHTLHGDMTQTHKLYLKWIEGAGTQNIPSWSVSTLNVTGVTFPGVNNGAATEVQRLLINVPENFTVPELTPPTVSYNVDVQSMAYYFTGSAMGSNPELGPMRRGGTYTFNFSANVAGHPFYLTTDDGTNFVSGSYIGEYTDGVTGSRNTSGTLVFTVPQNAPDTLYYQCGNHSSMRGSITIKDLAVEVNNVGNYVLYFQHTQEKHFTPVEIRPKPSLPSNTFLVYNATSGEFEPTDGARYLDDTIQFKNKIEDLIVDTTSDKVTSVQVGQQIKDDIVYYANMHQPGQLQVIEGTTRWYAPYNLQVSVIRARLGTAADGTVSLLLKKNGITQKTINIFSSSTQATVEDQTMSMVAGEYLTVDVTSIGTNLKGSDLYIQIGYKKI